ncbi:MAG: FtsX-like permease family protein [Proteobacteria bacterium]|nr:FtsX-like permease family protein [Pseudomonadota bacterium]MBU1640817.1 FtsX-like permease family protein [Pseudomonadota bacterium]
MFRVLLRIALLSLRRRLSRSLLVIAMIAMSLWGLLFMEGLYDGMTEQVIDNAIRSDSGDLSLFAREYRLDPGLERLLAEPAEIGRFLDEDSRVRSHVSRLRQDGLIATAHYSRNAVIYGVDLGAEDRHGRLASYLDAGAYDFGDKGRGALLGARLATKMKVTVGQKIVVSAQNSANDVSALSLRVVGILKTNNMALDENAVFIEMNKARELLMVPEGVSQLSVLLYNKEKVAAVQQGLRVRFPELDVLGWDELYPALRQGREMMEIFNLITSLLVFCVAGLGIFGVMLVSVLERLREFGIMLAIGTTFREIRTMVFVESFILGFSGYGGGVLLGGLTLLYFYNFGLDLTMFSAGLDAFGMDAITYALIRPSYFFTALAAVSVATLVSVLLPLRILKKARPIEAINKI